MEKMNNMDVGTLPGRSAPKFAAQSLSDHEYTQQIRAALDIRWRLPKVDEATLARYYCYLCKKLSLPFTAWYPGSMHKDGESACEVAELIDPASGLGDALDGIYCKVHKGKQRLVLPLIELELPPDSPNYHMVESYWYWFWHWR
jgi:hypothetical protein